LHFYFQSQTTGEMVAGTSDVEQKGEKGKGHLRRKEKKTQPRKDHLEKQEREGGRREQLICSPVRGPSDGTGVGLGEKTPPRGLSTSKGKEGK